MPLLPGAEPWFHDGTAMPDSANSSTGILLIHGFTGSPASMVPWGKSMADHGWSVRVPRLPGHGSRWQDMNLTTWQDWYAESERNYRILRESCDNVFVFGLSMGGSLTLRLAQSHGNDIDGIVLVNPAVHSERADRHLLPVLSKIIKSFPGISNDINKPGQNEVAYDRIPLRAAHSLSSLWKIVKTDIGAVTQPLLLFRSENDHVVEPSNAEFILANVSSPEKREIVLPRSFHVATLDYDAEIIESESATFVHEILARKNA